MPLIEVTAEDIEAGEKGEFEDCPVTLALRRHGFEWAELTQEKVLSLARLHGRTVYAHNQLPRYAYVWGYRFDNDLGVEPFSFWMPGYRSVFVSGGDRGIGHWSQIALAETQR